MTVLSNSFNVIENSHKIAFRKSVTNLLLKSSFPFSLYRIHNLSSEEVIRFYLFAGSSLKYINLASLIPTTNLHYYKIVLVTLQISVKSDRIFRKFQNCFFYISILKNLLMYFARCREALITLKLLHIQIYGRKCRYVYFYNITVINQ